MNELEVDVNNEPRVESDVSEPKCDQEVHGSELTPDKTDGPEAGRPKSTSCRVSTSVTYSPQN